eukprot:NODE_1494_length_1147_cov_84.708561_g787_i2.p1 GENE.NODE_1494_length_1147_cov_84.708561_g787_i2~~NODE_1494_length_1147_cov_84.708561_g787_i2.p1  ORF type:complete len:121 (+),score=20.59 NODE_1494_length_1147_cov_84.708561_g787_i2:600-962(+)
MLTNKIFWVSYTEVSDLGGGMETQPCLCKEVISAGELSKELTLPMDEIKRTVHSLAFCKLAILKKPEDKKKTIAEDDMFMVNDDFTCPQRKFKVPNVVRTIVCGKKNTAYIFTGRPGGKD